MTLSGEKFEEACADAESSMRHFLYGPHDQFITRLALRGATEMVLENAERMPWLFDQVLEYSARRLEAGEEVPELLGRWIAQYLRGKLIRPKHNGAPDKSRLRGWIHTVVGGVCRDFGLRPTRNPLSPPRSGCDAVAIAMERLNEAPRTYERVRSIYIAENRLRKARPHEVGRKHDSS